MLLFQENKYKEDSVQKNLNIGEGSSCNHSQGSQNLSLSHADKWKQKDKETRRML